MAREKRTAFHNLDGLYRDVEAARRGADAEEPAAIAAWERWLELLDIALWTLDEREGPEVSSPADMEGCADDDGDPDDSHQGPDASGGQLELAGASGLDADVPRGTSRNSNGSVPLGGALNGMRTPSLLDRYSCKETEVKTRRKVRR